MASPMSHVHPRKEDSRTSSMLSLPPVSTSISKSSKACSKPCNNDRMSTTSARSTPDWASPTDPQPSLGERRSFQRSCRQTRFGASSSCGPVSVHRGGVSVQVINDAILKEVPNAVVAHVHDGRTSEASKITAISSSLDFVKVFTNSSPSFIVVDSREQCAKLTIEMLRDQVGQFDGPIVIVLTQLDATVDFGPIVDKVSEFMDSGADDVIVIPVGARSIDFSIAVSWAKAKAGRNHKITLQKQIEACNKQCNRLFWDAVHGFLPAFPKNQHRLNEILEKRVGPLDLVCKLGEGAYGSVYKWQDETTNKTGAVKVFAKSSVSSFNHALQIATEIATLRRLKHRNVVKFLAAAHGMQCVYLSMEFAGSRNLFGVIDLEGERGLPWSRAGGLLPQIAAGVAHCHKMLVAHCDLKPENIVISDYGCAKIVDLGQAVNLAEDVAPLQSIKGTMPFIAPEIMRPGLAWDPCAADVWSLAVIVVEMLCGNHAFVHLLGWHALGRDLTNPSKLAQRADELKIFFAKDETKTHGNAFRALPGLCSDVPAPVVFDLLNSMFELMPESRILAETVAESAECIEYMSD